MWISTLRIIVLLSYARHTANSHYEDVLYLTLPQKLPSDWIKPPKLHDQSPTVHSTKLAELPLS